MKSLKFLTVAFAVTLGACSATSYQMQTQDEGYAEQEIRPNVWRVMFFGNKYTSVETVQTYWLYRCAELTSQQGFDGFEILSGVTLTQQQEAAEPVHLAAAHSHTTYVPIYVPGGAGGAASSPQIVAEIRLIKAPIMVAPGKTYRAAELQAQLEPNVKGAKCTKGNVCPYKHFYMLSPTLPPTG